MTTGGEIVAGVETEEGGMTMREARDGIGIEGPDHGRAMVKESLADIGTDLGHGPETGDAEIVVAVETGRMIESADNGIEAVRDMETDTATDHEETTRSEVEVVRGRRRGSAADHRIQGVAETTHDERTFIAAAAQYRA